MGVEGLWYGFALGYLPAIAMYMLLIYHIDWHGIMNLSTNK